MTRKPIFALLTVLALVFALSGCGSDEPASSGDEASPSASPSEAEETEAEEPEETESEEPKETDSEEPEQEPAMITISDFEFDSPDSVAPGQTIMVTNEDDVLHTVTADDGSFDVSIDGGATAEFKAPDEAGEFPFICTPHPHMKSTLVVE